MVYPEELYRFLNYQRTTGSIDLMCGYSVAYHEGSRFFTIRTRDRAVFKSVFPARIIRELDRLYASRIRSGALDITKNRGVAGRRARGTVTGTTKGTTDAL